MNAPTDGVQGPSDGVQGPSDGVQGPSDGADRDCIRTQLGTSLLCLAGAGAGKTHELVERMAACVAEGFAPVERLAAITFTRKAAGEMRGRLFVRLRQLQQPATGDRARRLGAATRNIDQCYIGTIHSFCARLLRERPVEAGLTPGFSEVEEREELSLLRAAWDSFLKERAGVGDERLVHFDELGVKAEDFYPFFVRRCQFSDLPLKKSTASAPDLDAAVARILAFLDDVDDHVPDPLPRDPDRFMQTASTTRDFLKYASPLKEGDRAHILAQFLSPSTAKITLNRWQPNADFARHLRDRLLPQLAAEIEPVARQWRQYLYRLAAGFVDDALSSYRRQRMVSGTLTFQDLLELSAALLRDNEAVRSYFQRRYRVLFVDEFQDTDPLQAQMVLYLTSTDNAQRDWRQLEPRPGGLFVVGDEQQSIYRFRRADVEIFRFMADRLVQGGGEVVRLTTSFRSRGGLCSWINTAFGPLFARCDRRYQAEFQALHAHRLVGDDQGVRALTHEKEGRFPRRRVAAADASRIAGFVAAAIGGRTQLNGEGEAAVLPKEASAGDFMILTRTTGMLSVYARALEERDIPYDVTGAGSVRQAVELRALVEMLEAVYDPRDPLPLTAYLRGTLVGLGDDELYDFRLAGGVFDWRRELPAALDPELAGRVREAFQWLKRAWIWVQELTPAAAVERLLADTGLLPLAAARGSSQAGGLLRVLALVRTWESRRLLDWGQVLRELRDLIDRDDLRVEEMSLETGRDDVVRLMNLHQAKGLEARVVFLADPCDTSYTRHDVEAHVSRLAAKPYLSMVVRRRFATGASTVLAEPEGWDEERALEEDFSKAEELRLLYVAATRARDLLVVSRYRGGGSTSGGPWSGLNGALESVPELELVPEPMPAGEYGGGARSAEKNSLLSLVEQLELEGEERDRRWRAVKVASHEVTAVTAEAQVREWEVAAQLRGRGREFGAIVHQLFEAAVKGHLPLGQEEAYVRSLAEVEGTVEGTHEGAGLVREVMAELAQMKSSSLWEEVQAANEVFAEVPIALSTGTGGERQVTRGIIDLVYRVEGKGWKIVDYKTDRAVEGEPALDKEMGTITSTGDAAEPVGPVAETTAAASAALIARYGAQVADYASYWHTVTGEVVVEKGLWSRQTGYVSVA